MARSSHEMAKLRALKACYNRVPTSRFRNRASARQDSKRRYTWTKRLIVENSGWAQ